MIRINHGNLLCYSPRRSQHHQETMPKSKSQSVVPAARAAPGGARKRKGAGKSGLAPFHRLLADPFHASLEMASKPDLNTRPVVLWREEDAMTLTTNAQGDLWLSLRPTLNAQRVTNTMDAGGTVTAVSGASAVNYTELTTTFSEFRPMVMCAQIEYIGQADLAKGVLFGAHSSAAAVVGDSVLSLTDETYYTECRADKGPVTVKLLELSTDTFGAIDSVFQSEPVSVIQIGCLGAPASTACIRLRLGFVFEAVVGHTKLLSRNAAPGPSNFIDMSIAANITGQSALLQSGPDGYDKMVSHAERIVDAAVKAHAVGTKVFDAAERLAPLLALMAA